MSVSDSEPSCGDGTEDGGVDAELNGEDGAEDEGLDIARQGNLDTSVRNSISLDLGHSYIDTWYREITSSNSCGVEG